MIQVRNARLDDTGTISKLFRQQVTAWQRLDESGHVQDLPYEALSVYERWLHGGPWMSIETGAVWLNHLLLGNGIGLAAFEDSRISGYAEVFAGNEPAPFGKHLHIAHLICHPENGEVRTALLNHITEIAGQSKCQHVTLAISGYDTEQAAFYESFGMKAIVKVGRCTIPAHTGQGFYKATPHQHFDATQIDGWQMPAGRVESARQHWETLWPPLWTTIEEIRRRQHHRMHFSAAGQNALVICQQHLYDPRSAEIFCWSSMPLKSQLLTAICDWAHRENYRRLTFAVPENTIQQLGSDVETHPYQQNIYALDLDRT
jgi:hypothetical protein